jgi:hypothetical protein
MQSVIGAMVAAAGAMRMIGATRIKQPVTTSGGATIIESMSSTKKPDVILAQLYLATGEWSIQY